jgi:hypothetical protein
VKTRALALCRNGELDATADTRAMACAEVDDQTPGAGSHHSPQNGDCHRRRAIRGGRAWLRLERQGRERQRW